MLGSRRETVDGYEMTFQVNHLGPFLLTNLFRDAARRRRRGARRERRVGAHIRARAVDSTSTTCRQRAATAASASTGSRSSPTSCSPASWPAAGTTRASPPTPCTRASSPAASVATATAVGYRARVPDPAAVRTSRPSTARRRRCTWRRHPSSPASPAATGRSRRPPHRAPPHRMTRPRPGCGRSASSSSPDQCQVRNAHSGVALIAALELLAGVELVDADRSSCRSCRRHPGGPPRPASPPWRTRPRSWSRSSRLAPWRRRRCSTDSSSALTNSASIFPPFGVDGVPGRLDRRASRSWPPSPSHRGTRRSCAVLRTGP